MQASLMESERITLTACVELTTASLCEHGKRYDHWAIAFSGGKDSSCVATIVPQLIANGNVPAPKSLTVLYADTRLELPPLYNSAMGIMDKLKDMGISCRVVLPTIEDRFFVYMLGRGVPPPSNTFRWCTSQMKIEPMMEALKKLRDQAGQKVLMLTGVRVGESAVRDAKIVVACGRNGAECGQGWFQEATPESVADTLAPILHWRVCLVWKWLRQWAPMAGFPTEQVADAYGGDEAEEVNCRTGCVGCNLASRDTALEKTLRDPAWGYLQPLMRLRPLYAELKRPHNRLRKTSMEKRRDGTNVTNPNRMGPLTMDARRMGLETVLQIQREICEAASKDGRPLVSLINDEERTAIQGMISSNVWPNGWSGDEARADDLFVDLLPDGREQGNLLLSKGME